MNPVDFEKWVLAEAEANQNRSKEFNEKFEHIRLEVGVRMLEQKHLEKIQAVSNRDLRPVWYGEEWHDPKIALEVVTRMNKGGFSISHVPNKKRAVDNGRRVCAKPGRFLKKYYGDKLSDKDIEYWAQAHKSKTEGDLKFARTPEEIANVYKDGPHSCMVKKSFPLGDTPVKAYAAGDLAIAYINRGGVVIARAVCWPDKKIFQRKVYGEGSMLRHALSSQGYKEGSIEGARLLKLQPHIEHKALREGCDSGHYNGYPEYYYSLPYVDGSAHFIKDDGAYFVLTAGQQRPAARNEHGLVMVMKCTECHEISKSYTRPGYCDTCLSKMHTNCITCYENVSMCQQKPVIISSQQYLPQSRERSITYVCGDCYKSGVKICRICAHDFIGYDYNGFCAFCARGHLKTQSLKKLSPTFVAPKNVNKITVVYHSELNSEYEVFINSKFGSEKIDHCWTYLRPKKNSSK